MIAEHMHVLRLLGPCIAKGSTRKAEPAGDLCWDLLQGIAYTVVGVGQANLKSVVQDVRKDRLELCLKLPSTG